MTALAPGLVFNLFMCPPKPKAKLNECSLPGSIDLSSQDEIGLIRKSFGEDDPGDKGVNDDTSLSRVIESLGRLQLRGNQGVGLEGDLIDLMEMCQQVYDESMVLSPTESQRQAIWEIFNAIVIMYENLGPHGIYVQYHFRKLANDMKSL